MRNEMIDLLRENISPAEAESSVRTYVCTYYKSRLLGLEATGYLAVTNKRVIFQAAGTSNAGSSVIQSEVPIEDVSGISSYKGTYFSIGHLLAAFVVSVVGGALLNAVVTLLTALLKDTDMVVPWIAAVLAVIVSFFLPRKALWRPVLASMSAFAFALSGVGSYPLDTLSLFTQSFNSDTLSFFTQSDQSGTSYIAFLLSFAVGIYALFCYFWYARRPTITLAVHSKGGSSTPISISGASGLGIFDIAAGKALNAEPAQDAEPMLKELGAVILDIQKMGDFGIEKWQSGRLPNLPTA